MLWVLFFYRWICLNTELKLLSPDILKILNQLTPPLVVLITTLGYPQIKPVLLLINKTLESLVEYTPTGDDIQLIPKSVDFMKLF